MRGSDLDQFLTIMVVHLVTTVLGGLYVYKRGATPARTAVLAAWVILFFPVAYNVMKFI